jgi:hypothetical protein
MATATNSSSGSVKIISTAATARFARRSPERGMSVRFDGVIATVFKTVNHMVPMVLNQCDLDHIDQSHFLAKRDVDRPDDIILGLIPVPVINCSAP